MRFKVGSSGLDHFELEGLRFTVFMLATKSAAINEGGFSKDIIEGKGA